MPSPTRGKGVLCQQIDFGGPGGSYFRTVPISQRLRYFDSVVSSVTCFAGGPSAVYCLDTRVAGNLTRLEQNSSTCCSRREDPELVPNLLWFVLENGVSYC